MARIHLRGSDGFVAEVDSEKITSFGIDPAVGRKLWVIVDGKDFSFSVDVDEQFEKLIQILGDCSLKVAGIQKEGEDAKNSGEGNIGANSHSVLGGGV
jgi:hypothetical protein